MSKLFEQLQELGDTVHYSMLVEPCSGKWALFDDTVYWEIDGTVYSGELFEGTHKQDGCMFINLNNGSGVSVTNVFLLEQEESEEMFTISYEGQM